MGRCVELLVFFVPKPVRVPDMTLGLLSLRARGFRSGPWESTPMCAGCHSV